jgi:hypothetical protein
MLVERFSAGWISKDRHARMEYSAAADADIDVLGHHKEMQAGRMALMLSRQRMTDCNVCDKYVSMSSAGSQW